MIIAAFSTLGKTYEVKKHPGSYYDFEVNKMSKGAGFSGWDNMPARERFKLGKILARFEFIYHKVFVTIPEVLLYLPCEKNTLVYVITPSYGVEEFKKRLIHRYGNLDDSQEWKYLGGDNYVPSIKRYLDIAAECDKRKMHVHTSSVYYLSDFLNKGNRYGGNNLNQEDR